MKYYSFSVYLGSKKIDTVFYPHGETVEVVKQDLINHDGYHPNIVVKGLGRHG